jgi:protein TonB
MAFLQKNLNTSVPASKGAKPGTYEVIVQFIVDEKGVLSKIKPLTSLGYGMEEEVVRLMQLSPKWIPAMQNGRKVTAYKKQIITFVIPKS